MTKKNKSNFEISLRMRDFEITQLVQRNNFFMVFQGVLFAGIVQSAHSMPAVSFCVCMVGFFISLFQVGMASGSKYWQEYWEAKLSEFEPVLFHENEFEYQKKVQERLRKRGVCNFIEGLIIRRYSVSRIPIYAGIAFALIWFILLFCTLRGYPPFGFPSFIVGFNCSS